MSYYLSKNIKLEIKNYNNSLYLCNWVLCLVTPHCSKRRVVECMSHFTQFLLQCIQDYCEDNNIYKDIDWARNDDGELEPKRIQYHILGNRVIIEWD